jgi:hypothetical protein
MTNNGLPPGSVGVETCYPPQRSWKKSRSLLQTILLIVVLGLSLPQCCHGFADATIGAQLEEEENSSPPASSSVGLQEASNWLEESLGVSGLCHPQSNDYAPAFPKCTETADNNIDRRLAQDNYTSSEREYAEIKSLGFIGLNLGLALLCVVAGGLAAGLTVGYVLVRVSLYCIHVCLGIRGLWSNFVDTSSSASCRWIPSCC